MENERFKICEYTHWIVYLNQNQYYLGRLLIWAKREDSRDIMDTTQEERDELFNIMKDLKGALQKAFQPDMFNYAALGNISHHTHVHIIPRYKKTRKIQSMIFHDKRWGMNFVSHPETVNTSPEIIEVIRETVTSYL